MDRTGHRLPVCAENSVTLIDLHVFVDEAAEPVSSKHAAGRPGMWRRAGCGRVLMQRSVRTVAGVVLNVLAQHYIAALHRGGAAR